VPCSAHGDTGRNDFMHVVPACKSKWSRELTCTAIFFVFETLHRHVLYISSSHCNDGRMDSLLCLMDSFAAPNRLSELSKKAAEATI